MKENGQKDTERHAVAIVGGGPIGIEMAIALERAGIDYVLFEAKQIGQTISTWPPNTHFFSTPEHVALAGIPVQNVDQRAITGEQYLAYLRMLVEYFDLKIQNYEPVTDLVRKSDHFHLQSRRLDGREVSYQFDKVILATGGLSAPRILGVPGEDLPHVSHYFPGPHPYFRRRLLVVGGKNSALEAALRCWRAGAEVTISYRRPQFDFDVVKPHLGDDVATRIEKGEIGFLPSTVVVEIAPGYVTLATCDEAFQVDGGSFRHETDFVLLATGFVADMELFRKVGVTLQGERKVPLYDPQTMETDVPDLFVAGTAAGGTQVKFEYFISTSHDHVARIMHALTGAVPERLGTVEGRNSAVSWEEVRAN
ncbi:MAG: NAD(P)-binding domain-containing protein [Candidatus Promineifilaceae bacterium]|nr:NAD(P)-binding domain-containing protein [Candidatus Promineifilaceae bacterium]